MGGAGVLERRLLAKRPPNWGSLVKPVPDSQGLRELHQEPPSDPQPHPRSAVLASPGEGCNSAPPPGNENTAELGGGRVRMQLRPLRRSWPELEEEDEF